MMVTTMVMERIENLSSPLNSTTSTMRHITARVVRFQQDAVPLLDVSTVRQLAVGYEMLAQVRDSQTQSCISPRRTSARRPLKLTPLTSAPVL